MLKLMKYELRRALMGLIVVACLILATQLYFVLATVLQKDTHVMLSFMLFIMTGFGSYMYVLIQGIATYNSDLKNKWGYMVFMTPESTYKIIISKLLSNLVIGLAIVAFYVVLTVLDWSLFSIYYKSEELLDTFDFILAMFTNSSTTEAFAIALIWVFAFIANFFAIITVAYAAISLSATLLQNKKGKGFVSFLFFCVLIGITQTIASKLTTANAFLNDYDTSAKLITAYIADNAAAIILHCVVICVSVWFSGFLLKNKIDL